MEVIVETLRKGKTAILKCDTIYGIVGIAPDTEEQIQTIKKRRPSNSLIQLISDVHWVRRFTVTPLPQQLKSFWPGPLTIIFPVREGQTVALRIPADTWLRDIIRSVGKPLFSTSVNTSGRKPLHIITEIIKEFSAAMPVIVDSGDALKDVPSTILDITSVPYRVVRQGEVRLSPELLVEDRESR